MGNKRSDLERHEQTIKYFDEAIDKDRNNVEAWNNKGLALNDLEEYDEAIKCADKALEIDANNALALAIKGEALGCKCEFNEAIEYANKALEIDENSDYAWFVKGYALDYSSKHDDALKCFDKAIEYCSEYCPKDSFEAWIAKGIALNYKNSYYEAEKCFNEVITLGDEKEGSYQDIAYAYLNKSVSLNKLEREKDEKVCLTEAKNYSEKSISRNPNDAHSWMIKGAYYFKSGSYDVAVRCYNKIITDINPKFDHAWCLKGYALNYLERYEEALNYFDEAIRINSKDPDYHMGKGISLYGLEKYDEAIICFDKAEHQERAYVDVVSFFKGECNYGMELYSKALYDFKNVGSDVKLAGQKHNNIGACYHKKGLVEKARNEYEAAIESATRSNSKLPEAYYNLGVLNNDDGKTDIARKDFEDCLKEDRKFTKAREALKKLDSTSSTSEWFKWWFSSGEGKKVLGVTLILSIFALIIFTIITNAFTLYHNQNIASNTRLRSLNKSSCNRSILFLYISS